MVDLSRFSRVRRALNKCCPALSRFENVTFPVPYSASSSFEFPLPVERMRTPVGWSTEAEREGVLAFLYRGYAFAHIFSGPAPLVTPVQQRGAEILMSRLLHDVITPYERDSNNPKESDLLFMHAIRLYLVLNRLCRVPLTLGLRSWVGVWTRLLNGLLPQEELFKLHAQVVYEAGIFISDSIIDSVAQENRLLYGVNSCTDRWLAYTSEEFHAQALGCAKVLNDCRDDVERFTRALQFRLEPVGERSPLVNSMELLVTRLGAVACFVENLGTETKGIAPVIEE